MNTKSVQLFQSSYLVNYAQATEEALALCKCGENSPQRRVCPRGVVKEVDRSVSDILSVSRAFWLEASGVLYSQAMFCFDLDW